MKSTCGTCRFYDWDVCKRYPPVYVRLEEFDRQTSERWTFPPVEENDWCGEFREKEVEPS